MIKLTGFKFAKAAGVEAFLQYYHDGGTVALVFELQPWEAIEMLSGAPELDFLKGLDDEDVITKGEEFTDLKHMLLMACSVTLDNIHGCSWCHYVSTEKPCDCGRGLSVEGLELTSE